MSCKTQDNSKNSIQKLEPISMYEENGFKQIYSPNKKLILFVKAEHSRSDPATHFEYFIKNVKDGDIIYKGRYRGENIQWNDNESLRLTPYVGIIQKQNDNLDLQINNKTERNIKIIKIK